MFIQSVHKKNYVNVFFLNVAVSKFHLVCFCAAYWISRFEEVLLLGPDTPIAKPNKAPIMPVCANASGTDWMTLKQELSQRGNRALSPFKQRCVSRRKGSGKVPVAVVGSAGAL